MIECGFCSRSFGTPEAFEGHCANAASHKSRFCDSKNCSLRKPTKFTTDAQFQDHIRNQHPTIYSCTPCGITSLGSHLNLLRHFRQVAAHPNCTKCAEGMEDDAALMIHMRVKHPKRQCVICGAEEYVDEMQAHFLHSDKHPKCIPCNLGFETDEDFSKHEHTDEPASAEGGGLSPTDSSGPVLTRGNSMAEHIQRLMDREYSLSNSQAADTAQDSEWKTVGPVAGPSRLTPFNPQQQKQKELQTSLVPPAREPSISSALSVDASSTAGVNSPSYGRSTRSSLPEYLRPLSPVSDDMGPSVPQGWTQHSSVQSRNDFTPNGNAGTLRHAPALHCRLCHANPCIEMTSTFCGHIFCKRCITTRLINTPYCPVCDAANLLYMIFKIDLSV